MKIAYNRTLAHVLKRYGLEKAPAQLYQREKISSWEKVFYGYDDSGEDTLLMVWKWPESKDFDADMKHALRTLRLQGYTIEGFYDPDMDVRFENYTRVQNEILGRTNRSGKIRPFEIEVASQKKPTDPKLDGPRHMREVPVQWAPTNLDERRLRSWGLSPKVYELGDPEYEEIQWYVSYRPNLIIMAGQSSKYERIRIFLKEKYYPELDIIQKEVHTRHKLRSKGTVGRNQFATGDDALLFFRHKPLKTQEEKPETYMR